MVVGAGVLGAYLLWKNSQKTKSKTEAVKPQAVKPQKEKNIEKAKEVVAEVSKDPSGYDKLAKTFEELLKKRDADVQAQLEKTQEELKKYKEQLNKQPEPAPSVVTTQSQLEEIMVSKAQERVDTEEIKTLEERVSNETDLIQKLQEKLKTIDTSTVGGKRNAELILETIENAERRKREKAKNITTIIDIGGGKTGYQQLLPMPEWTLEDLLDDTKRIIIQDRLDPKYPNTWWYEFNPIDSDVPFIMKGNWVAWSPKHQKVLNVLNKNLENAVLTTRAKDPRRYDVRFFAKQGTAKPEPVKTVNPVKPVIPVKPVKPIRITPAIPVTKRIVFKPTPIAVKPLVLAKIPQANVDFYDGDYLVNLPKVITVELSNGRLVEQNVTAGLRQYFESLSPSMQEQVLDDYGIDGFIPEELIAPYL